MANNSLGLLILDRMVSAAGGAIEPIYSAIMGSWPAVTITGLYVAVVAYMIMLGHAGSRWKDWALSIFLLLILGGVSSYGVYSNWIGAPIYDTFYGLAGVPAQEAGGIEGLFGLLEENIGRTMATIDKVKVPGDPISDFFLFMKAGIAIFFLTIIACVLYLETTALFCISVFSLLVMILAGGPCIWLASFKEFRGITWAWFKNTCNYGLWMFFISVVVSIGMQFLNLAVDDLTAWNIAQHGVFTERLGTVLLLMCLTGYMMLKASEWAAALTGGTASQTGVIGAVASMGGSAVGGGLNAAGRMASPALAAGAGIGGRALWAGAGGAVRGAMSLGVKAYSAMRGIK